MQHKSKYFYITFSLLFQLACFYPEVSVDNCSMPVIKIHRSLAHNEAFRGKSTCSTQLIFYASVFLLPQFFVCDFPNIADKELTEEIERLNNLQQEGLCNQGNGNKVDFGSIKKPGNSQAAPNSSTCSSARKTRKRSRQIIDNGVIEVAQCATEQINGGVADDLYNQTEVSDVLPKYFLVC